MRPFVPFLQERFQVSERRACRALPLAEPAALRMALRYGIDLGGHAAHRMRAADVGCADLIIAMEGYQRARVRRSWSEGAAKTHLLGDFFERGPFLIADPFGRDDEIFAAIFDRIARGIEALAQRVEARFVR